MRVTYADIGSTYYTLGDYGKALGYQIKCKDIREKVLPPDHPDLATAYNNIAIIQRHLAEKQGSSKNDEAE